MTEISLDFKQAAYAQETGRVPILLITLDHDDLEEPIRLSTTPVQRIAELTTDEYVVYGVVSNGETYIYLPMTVKLPDDTDSGPGEATLEIDNVHRMITAAVRSIFTPVDVTVDIVMDNDLDTVVKSWPTLQLKLVVNNFTTATGTLGVDSMENEPCPCDRFTPGQFPYVFS